MPAVRSRPAKKGPAIPPAPAIASAHAAFDLLPIGIGIFNRDLCLTYANAPFGELRDLPPSLCRPGTRLADIARFNAARGDFGPGDIEEQAAERIAEIARFQPRALERDYRDGRRLAVRFTPIDGAGVMLTYTDVTDARRMEQSLRDNEERYSLVTQAVAEGIYDWNIADNALWVSSRLIEIFGWDEAGTGAGARPSQEWNDRVHPEDFELYRAVLRDALKGGTPRLHCEYRIRLSSGEYRWVEDSAVAVRDNKGWAERLVGAVSDITERKESERALREALEQQAATAEVLQVINGSPGDLTPVFDAMLEKALRLCEAEIGVLWTYDGELMHPTAIRSPSRRYAEFLRHGGPRRPAKPQQPLLQGERFVQIADLSATEGYRDGDSLVRAVVDLGGVRSLLNIALRKDDKVLGLFAIYRNEVRPFADKQIAVLENFAAQAVIAMENARLITETREALEQQTATAEVLGVINSSPGDLAPVFDAMLDKALNLCQAAFGALWTYDGEHLDVAAVRGAPSVYEQFLREGPHQPSQRQQRLLHGEPFEQIADLTLTEAYAARAPLVTAAVDLGGVRTLLAVPLRKDDKALGIFGVYRQEAHPFTDKQIALLQNFAAQAVIAMENARLITETREALEQQTATAEVLQVINSSPGDLAPVFDAMLEKAVRLCEASFGALHTVHGEAVHTVALRNVPTAFAEFLTRAPLRLDPEQSLLGKCIQERRTIHVPDRAAEESYRHRAPLAVAAVELGDIRALLHVPLVKEDASLGAFTIYRREVRPFTDKQIALLQNFAAQAVIAMENARLITETREALEQQTATSEVLQVINSSPGELSPVFDAMLEKALRLCEASFGVLYTYDGESFHSVGHRGVSAALAEFLHEPMKLRPDLYGAASQPGSLGLLLRGDSVVHDDNIADSEAYRIGYPLRRALVDLDGARTGVWVALRKDDKLLGTFVIYRREIRPFSDKQIALLQNFAAQAVIAMENARLITETREALEQQTATSEVLQVINASPGDLAPVFDAMLQKASRLCDGHTGHVVRLENGALSRLASFGVPEEFDRLLPLNAPMPDAMVKDSLPERMIASRSVIHVPDLREDESYRVGAPAEVAAVKAGIRTALYVPLLKDSDVVGAFIVHRLEARPFSDKQIALLQNFAAQAVIAMENARLMNETREALEQQTATAEILGVISSSPTDVQPTFDAIAESAVRLCGAMCGGVFRFDGSLIHVVADYGWTPDELEVIRQVFPLPPGRGSVTTRAILTCSTQHVADMAADPEYLHPSLAGIMRATLSVPMLRDGNPIGAITITRREAEPFSEAQIKLVSTFADQAVIAIENTRLFNELQDRTHDLQQSLEYQTATSDVLQVISQSGADLDPALDTLVATAARLCAAEKGIIWRSRDGQYHLAASFGFSPEFRELMEQNPIMPGRGTMGGRTLLECRPVQIHDLATDPEYIWTAAQQLGEIHSALGVPLFREGTPIGVIALARSRVEPFSAKEVQLVSTFADQAVIAIENTRLLGELRERTGDLEESLEYQTATSDVLKVISRSTFDLQPVLNTVAETAARLCEAQMAFIFRRDGDVFRLAISVGFAPEVVAIVEASPIVPGRGTITGRAALTGTVAHIPDATRDPEYTWTDFLQAAQSPRTMLAVPLLRRDEVVGVITLGRDRIVPFTERQIELVRTFADQAVIAIENTRLITETQEALEQQTATAEVLGIINSSPGNLSPVFDAMLEKATRLCDGVQGVLWTIDGEIADMAATYGLPAEFEALLRGGETPVVGPPLALRQIMAGERLLNIPDLAEHELYRSGSPLAKASVERGGVRTLIWIALVKDGAAVGAFVIARREVRPFSDKQIALLQSFAAQAVIAMDNARLLDEIRQRQAELRVTFDNMGDGVAMFDGELRLAAWNMNFEQILDLPDAFLAERPTFAEYFGYLAQRGEYGDMEPELRQSVQDSRREARFERTRPDGKVIEVRRNPVPGGGFVLMLSDITERKRAEAEIRAARDAAEAALAELRTAQASLIHAEKMASLGQLTAGIAHEIKNPLNFVNNFAGLSVELLDELKQTAAPGIATLDEDTRAEIDETVEMLTGNLQKIAEHGSRADGIVKSMLAHSRGGSGERQAVDINSVIEEALNLAYHGARAQDQSFNITLERDLDASLTRIELVPQDMTRVFLNLFGNGFYAANKRRQQTDDPAFRPTLTVATRDLDDAVEIRVRDNGVGISPEHRDKLFHPFFTTKPTGEGTGLGLSISYDIVTQEHGGAIAVDSEPGEFTEFTITLPRRASPTQEGSVRTTH